MRYPLYSIKDDLIGFGVPFVGDNDPVAVRYFGQAVSQEGSVYSLNKSNFSLYKVGEFDTDSGEVFPSDRVYVCSALDFKED